jgi:3-(3-hydroxy-phenyl)propionate hydroxylase
MNRVAVVGAGPVGLTAALLLARWGIGVVLLDERAERDAAGSRAICQQRDVLDIWCAIGCEAIAAEGLTWTTARTYYGGKELFSWSFAAPRVGLPPFVNISQTRTEQILGAALADSPLIDVKWEHEVTGLVQDGGRVTVRCANGDEFVVPYVLLCAGARAGVLRDGLGIGFPGQTFDDRFLICDVRASMPERSAERSLYFDPPWNPGRQVLIHPCPGSVFRIDCQVPGDTPGDPGDWVRHITGERPYELVWQSVYRFHSRVATGMRAGRVLLAGDCAHLIAPFGARGLNSGVPDAENAAWKLAFVLNGWAPPALLSSYEAERLAAALENQQITDATMRFMVPRTAADRSARAAVLDAATGDPDLAARTVDSGRFAEPFWYLDSALTTANPARVFPGRPPRGQEPAVVPGVLVPDGQVAGRKRFRELVRSGIGVLCAGDGAGFAAAVRAVTSAPCAVWDLRVLDETGALSMSLGAVPGDAFVLRPDGHIAAILPAATPPDVAQAVARMLAIS